MIYESVFDVNDCILVVCVSVWLLSIITQAYFYLKYFLPFSYFKNSTSSKQKFGVSIIIAAKNECENLEKHLPIIFQQSYSNFELIIVDDHSTDESLSFLEKQSDERLLVLSLTGETGKKAAVKYGIENAKHAHFVFTDADCMPQSNSWLTEMIAKFSNNHEIVLGHSSFNKLPGFLNLFIRYEAFMVATQYFSFALKGKAYMGVGRNLAYSRNIYKKSSSFQSFENIQSGDDDLLVNEMATNQNVAIVTNKAAQTKSVAEKSLRRYIFQKRRQLQAGEQYKKAHRIQLAAFGLSTLLFNTCTLILLYLSGNWPIILATFVVYWLVKVSILNKIANDLGDRDVLKFAWLLEFCHIIIITGVGVSTWIWKVDKWK